SWENRARPGLLAGRGQAPTQARFELDVLEPVLHLAIDLFDVEDTVRRLELPAEIAHPLPDLVEALQHSHPCNSLSMSSILESMMRIASEVASATSSTASLTLAMAARKSSMASFTSAVTVSVPVCTSSVAASYLTPSRLISRGSWPATSPRQITVMRISRRRRAARPHSPRRIQGLPRA